MKILLYLLCCLCFTDQVFAKGIYPLERGPQGQTMRSFPKNTERLTPILSSRKQWTLPKHEGRAEIVKTAIGFIGLPYVWGGTSPRNGFDCSGFTQYVLSKHGFKIPRTAAEQARQSKQKGYLGAGDIIFFYGTNSPTKWHTGIYIGKGYFIHAPRTGKKIQTSHLNENYFQKRFIGAWSPIRTQLSSHP